MPGHDGLPFVMRSGFGDATVRSLATGLTGNKRLQDPVQYLTR